jgi:Protein of unknown function (DUF2800)
VSAHSFFAPSAAHRWVNCPGSMAMPQNQVASPPSTFSDDGTASHEWAARCLREYLDADQLLGEKITLPTGEYVMDDARAGHIQSYLDDVRRRAMGGILLVEQRVDIPEFGEDQGGTADVIIIQPEQELMIVEDLKYGMGETVYAKENKQGLSYTLGALKVARMFADISKAMIVIHQPRLDHVDEWEFELDTLFQFALDAKIAIEDAGAAMILAPSSAELEKYQHPDAKTCRWCRAKATCSKLAKVVAEEVRMDFETVAAQPPVAPADNDQLSRAMVAVPLVELWCKAVRHETDKRVREGQTIVGSDGLAYKIVEGSKGNSAWRDAKEAEAALLGQLPPDKAYQPQEIISPTKAKDLLGKKKTKQMWTDVFVPLIARADGKPQLALGSDERPPYQGSAKSDDFEIDAILE